MSRPRSLTTASLAVAMRLPGAMLPFALLPVVAVSSESLLLAGAATALGILGTAITPLVAGPAAARHGARPVLLVFAALHIIALVVLSAALERLRTEQQELWMLLLAASLVLAAGLTVPPAASFARSRAWTVHQRAPETGLPVRAAHRAAAAAEDAALILGPALVGLLSFGFGASAGLLGAAALTTVVIPVVAAEHASREPSGLVGDSAPVEEPEDPGEVLRVSVPGLEHARQMLAEARGQSPGRRGEAPREVPPTDAGWLRTLPVLLVSAAALGLVLGGLWITLLDLGRADGHIGLLGFGGAGAAWGAVLSSRWLPRRFSSLDGVRRRRLFSVLAAATAAALLPAAVLVPPAGAGQMLMAGFAVLLGLCLGVTVVELHALVVSRAPSSALQQAGAAVAGAALCGLTLGTTAAGLAAEELGRGWGALAVLAGALVLAAVTLRR